MGNKMMLRIIQVFFVFTSLCSSAQGFDQQIPPGGDERQAANFLNNLSSFDDNKTTTSSVSLQLWPNSSTLFSFLSNIEKLCIYENCCCDPLCPLFDDNFFNCSETYLSTSPSEGNTLNETIPDLQENITAAVKLLSFMDCVRLPSSGWSYVMMVSRCDNSTVQSRNQQRQLCEDDTSNKTITSLPVTLKSSPYFIFKNVFCAFCHGYQIGDLDTQAFYYECHQNLSSQAEIESSIETSVCTLKADESKEQPLIVCTHASSVCFLTLNNVRNEAPEIPNSTHPYNEDSRCLYEYHENNQSLAGSLAKREVVKFVVNGYRCMYFPFYITTHMQKLAPGGSYPPDYSTPNFKIFFDLKEDSWSYTNKVEIIPVNIECSSDQVYVIYIGGCQPLLCPSEMYPYKGQCLLRNVAVADRSLLLFPNGTHQMSFHVIIEYSSHCDVQVRTAVQNITETFQMALNHTMNIAKSILSSSSGNTSDWRLDLNVENVYSTVRHIVDATYLALINSIEFLQTDEVRIVRVLLSNINETFINETKGCSTGVLTIGSENLTLETNASGEYFIHRVSTLYPIDRVGFTLQLYPTNNTTVTLVQAALCVIQDPNIPHCPKGGAVALSNVSYMLQNNILVNLINGQQYESHEFVIRADGIAVVCYKSIDEKYLLLFTFYSVEQVATLICLLVSIVSLLLVLLTYSLLPQLRNIPGIIVMSLSATMLTMQGLMLLVLLPRGWLCLTVAWLLHWSMLATFLWNSALAFDVAFTLRSKSFGHTSKGSRGRFLRYYIMLCWLLPLLVVVCLGVMDHYDIYDVGYAAGGQCCIGTRSAILWLVIAPMSFTLLFNCACFVCTFSTMLHTAQLMRKSTTSTQRGSKPVDKRKLFVYIRITLIMGFTWAVGFVAAFAELEELWIAHIVLNALQGLYFLISFVLKRRVWNMLWDRSARLRPSRQGTVASPQKNMTISRVTKE